MYEIGKKFTTIVIKVTIERTKTKTAIELCCLFIVFNNTTKPSNSQWHGDRHHDNNAVIS